MYAPLIIEPRQRDPFKYDRDYVIMLSDWTDEDPKRIIRNLKNDSSWYNYNRQTLVGLIRELGNAPNDEARKAIVNGRVAWGLMRMDPTDVADVAGYTFLMNGQSPERNFTALARPGERVRLRFINASTSTYFDVRIPGLKMTVVQARPGTTFRPCEWMSSGSPSRKPTTSSCSPPKIELTPLSESPWIAPALRARPWHRDPAWSENCRRIGYVLSCRFPTWP